MKQILQNLRTGETSVAEVPAPRVRPGCLLIRCHASVVSVGTERMLIDFGKASLLEKARQQPDKVRQILQKVRTDGLAPTLQAVRAKLEQPIGLGYSSAGAVLEVGAGVEGFAVGDRVASNGPHAEVVCVPQNLCARVPEGVALEQAAYTVVAAIGLQGIRLAQPTLGECVAVTGLGLIGLLTLQMLRAQGCRVLGIDVNAERCALARRLGAQTVDLSSGADPVAAGLAFSRGRGVDAALITAATRSDEPVHQAAQMLRKRGRIVLVGVTGLHLSREDFYRKELSFRVSCSYGPGRYDPAYEERGEDYPVGHVRWTEQRNFEAVLDMMAAGALDTQALTTHRVPFADAVQAYGAISGGGALGVLLQYAADAPLPTAAPTANTVIVRSASRSSAVVHRPSSAVSSARLAVIGAGCFTGQVLLPALQKAGGQVGAIASSTGVTAAHLARKFGIPLATTDADALLADPAYDAALVTTPHNTHARYVAAALRAGKRVYVEKPLCLTPEELCDIQAAYVEAAQASVTGLPFLMVGFNRRYAPQVVQMRRLLASVSEPLAMLMTVNAGAVSPEHWTQDPSVGGGRILGEGCHFVDLLRFLAASPIVEVCARAVRTPGGPPRPDTASITLQFASGSQGTLHYLATGSKAFAKERLEVFTAGRVLQLDNFRVLRGFGWPGFRAMKLRRQDKGHAAEMQALLSTVQTGAPSPTPFEEIVEVTAATLEAARQVAQAG